MKQLLYFMVSVLSIICLSTSAIAAKPAAQSLGIYTLVIQNLSHVNMLFTPKLKSAYNCAKWVGGMPSMIKVPSNSGSYTIQINGIDCFPSGSFQVTLSQTVIEDKGSETAQITFSCFPNEGVCESGFKNYPYKVERFVEIGAVDSGRARPYLYLIKPVFMNMNP